MDLGGGTMGIRGHDDRAVEALISAARTLAASSGDTKQAYNLFNTALSLDPGRLELHVEMAELEVRQGNIERAQERMALLAECYVRRSCDLETRAFLRGADAWEQEFGESWEKNVPAPDEPAAPPPAWASPKLKLAPRHRGPSFNRYSIATLRARAHVRRNPAATTTDPSAPLAETLRKLGGFAAK